MEVRGVALFEVRVGTGPELVVLHGGPGAHHDYLRPGFDRLADIGLIAVRGQDDDGGANFLLAHAADGLDAGGAGHTQVEQYNIRLDLLGELDAGGGVVRLGGNHDLTSLRQQLAQALNHDRMIIYEQN